MEESDLSRLKQQYATLQKKYKLPSFSELNEDFEIEKLQEKETEYLLRSVRRVMIEKIANIVRFLELLLNPAETPTPLFVFAMIKGIKTDTRKDIEALYKEFCSIEITSLSLDIIYNEEAEAKFVVNVFKKWAENKDKMSDITKKLGATWSKESFNRDYLG